MTKLFEIRKDLETYRKSTVEQLRNELSGLRKEQFNLRFQRATGQLESTNRIKAVRRDIARVKTIQTERARSAQPQT